MRSRGRARSGSAIPALSISLSDRKLDKSSTTFDIRQRSVGSVVYELPFSAEQTGVMPRSSAGWQTNFIFTAQTGNATQVTDGTGLADSWSRFDRPDMVANPKLPRGDRTESRYFNTDAFQVVRDAAVRHRAAHDGPQPGLWNLDFTLAKKFRIRERLGGKLRADMYNLFNHANWRTIDTTIRDVTNPNIGPAGTLINPYGSVNGFGDPREMQLSLKFDF